jgi:hypothetical protein
MSLEPPPLLNQSQPLTNKSQQKRQLFIWGCIAAVAIVAILCYTFLQWHKRNELKQQRERAREQESAAWEKFDDIKAGRRVDSCLMNKFHDGNYKLSGWPEFEYLSYDDTFYGRDNVQVNTSNEGWIDTTYEIILTPSGDVKEFSVDRFE